jgi:hypothetical protein
MTGSSSDDWVYYRLQLVTTNNYYTAPDLHSLQLLHYNLLSLFPLVFTIRFLATDLNTGIITVTLNHTLPISMHQVFLNYN